MPRDMNNYKDNALRSSIIQRIEHLRSAGYVNAAEKSIEAIEDAPVTKRMPIKTLVDAKRAIARHQTQCYICDQIIGLINAMWPKETPNG